MAHREVEIQDGIQVFELDQWNDFHSLVEHIASLESQLTIPSYIWRGQRDSEWSLSTTLDRLFERLAISPADGNLLEVAAERHLEGFRLATRGRRGSNPPVLESQEWWALGQHFGLATPLLDWTRSPYAAAYFAFIEREDSALRAMYALDSNAIERKNDQIALGLSLELGRSPLLQVLDSLSNENARLVSQGGLFTRSPIGLPVEDWVSQNFEGSEEPVLIKLLLPNNERIPCLKALDRMNINHTSLFPDLTGASHATNLRVELYPEALKANV